MTSRDTSNQPVAAGGSVFGGWKFLGIKNKSKQLTSGPNGELMQSN